MASYVASTPTRIDLSGGTIDLWPIHQVIKHKATVHFGVDLTANTVIRLTNSETFLLKSYDLGLEWAGTYSQLPKAPLVLHSHVLMNLWDASLGGVEITTKANSPAGAGLGGSSSLLICIMKTLLQLKSNVTGLDHCLQDHAIVKAGGDIEANIIHAPTGCQDYWGALRGGVNIITYPVGAEKITSVKNNILDKINQHLLVCYSGQSRQSAINNWEIFKQVFDKQEQTIKNLEVLGKLSEDCAAAIEASDVNAMIELSKKEWLMRTTMWPAIHTAVTLKIEDVALKAGAKLVRVCGAGGGGVMAIFCDPEDKDRVASACRVVGGTILDAKATHKGYQCELRTET